MADLVIFRFIAVNEQHGVLLEQTLASLREDYDQRILSAVAEGRREEQRKAKQNRERLTLELDEQKSLAIEEEKERTKEAQQQVDGLRRVGKNKRMLIIQSYFLFS